MAPSGARARIQANLDALEAAAGIVVGGAPLTAEAQDRMGRYGGWGAADGPFAPAASGNDLRDQERLRAVLDRLGGSAQAGERLFNAAGLTTLNAHYTDPALVRAMYRALGDLGLEQGNIVEAGVGAGQFAAFAPDGIRITGIELDPATALIAQLLHPGAEILVGSVSGPRFARVRDQSANPVRVPRDTADGFAGNVPFSDVKWPDEALNPGTKFPLHDHAILWGVTRVAPGGLCAFITSRYTADKQNPGFRRTLAGEMDLIGMVRLPSTAHKRMAGTPVVTDIIIGRRLADGERPRTDPETWEQARPLPLPGTDVTPLVNTYFHANPQHVLGTLTAGGMRRVDDFNVAPSGDLEIELGAALGEIAGRALAAGQRHEPRPAARPVIEILSRRPDGTVTANPDGTFTQVVHGQDAPLKIDNEREADQTRRLVALAEALAALRRAEADCAEDTDETDAVRARMGKLYDDYTDAYGAIGRFTVRTQNYHIKTLKAVLDRLDFSKADVPDPEVTLLEAYLGRHALTRMVKSVADPGHVRHGTRKDKQGNEVATQTQLVQVAGVRAALTAALAEIPQGEDAERLSAAFGERMSRIETGEIRTRLMPVAFRSDPRRPAVEALENFDPVTQAAVKKPVFSRRTAVPHRLELGADTPEEALDLALIHRRRVDLPEIARLLGTDEADARKKLGTLVFGDPAVGGSLVAAGEYLSGNVREKLARARTAAAGDPERYTANVESLQAVQPSALGAEDIQARLGSAWLSRQIVQDGLRQILEDPTLTVTHPGGAAWSVSTRKDRNSNAQDRYGTSDWNAVDLAGALLTNASVVVYRKRIDPQTGEEKSYRDDNATLFAYRKAQRLDADFVSWLWSDPDRADECVRLYNSAYNNQVKRKWDSSPFYIPGLAPAIRLHPFQNAMVRRLHTESGLAAWVVGAGKTELGIVAAMEGNRLGRHELAAIVCPASLVNQWRDRIYRTYPQAQVLVADDDLRARRDAREIFVERAASGDYQLAVTPYEFFGSLPLSADAARASADEEIDKLTRYAKEAAAQGDRYTAKALQGQIARLEAQYSAAALAAGGATGFTDARITAVVVDEWHNFRRITRDSNNRAMAIVKGSGRADHMLAVFDYLRKRHPEGLLLGLSGTPLEQSIADAWAAMRFFAPERLKELGLEEFDAFLTTFGRTEARREPTPTGSGLHVRERASDWFNLPEMRRALWDPFADVVRSADLGLNVPRLTGGRPQTHVLPQIPVQASVQAEIDDGYTRFKAGDRGPDNHILRLMDRAAKNALHPRMLGMETDGQIKLEVWADDAAAWYHAAKGARFLDREGNPHPVPGALRMVACEIGVPDPARPNAWSVYSEMRSLLAARGVPADAVRFAQDAAGSDRKKAALWEDSRTGRCNFVIGSAQTAGTGVDVPDRLQVLDYMTLSWNPTQFEQWLGRIVRQGNQNPEVTANVWSTEGTIEVLRADKIAMKSAPFEALLDGTSGTRRVNEETYDPLSAWAAEMATRMSGNPLLNSQREAQLEVETAQGMQDEWQRENGVKARRVTVMNTEIQELEEKNAAIDRTLSRAVDTRGDKFAAQVGTARYTARAEAGAALIAALAATAAGDDVSALAEGNPQHLGELAGFPVTARYKRYEPDPPAEAEDGQDDEPDPGPPPGPAERTWIFVGLEGVPNGQVDMMSGGELPDRDPVGLMTSLESRIRRLPGDRDKNTAAIAENHDQITKTKAELAKPSPYLQQLADARDALDRIEAEIDAQLTLEPDAAAPADAEPASASPGEPAPDDGAEPAAGATPQWVQAVGRDPELASGLVDATAARVWHELEAAADVAGAPGPAATSPPEPNAASLRPGPAGTAKETAPAPGAPAEPGAGQADRGHPGSPDGVEEPGPGMTPEELGFVHQSAVNYALFGISRPSLDQEEQALDYAAWYIAEFGDEESMRDLPGHDHALRWFADRGNPAREPASTVDATVAQGPAGEATGAGIQADRAPAGQPDAMSGSDDVGQRAPVGSEPGAPSADDARLEHATTATGKADPALQPRARLPGAGPAGSVGDGPQEVSGVPRVTILHGHTSPETAYLVGDYPYGRLRCEKRYWLETADKGRYRGQVRLVTQTTNPKQPGRPWNKPHPEQYRAWSAMYLNQDGHVKVRSISDWGPSGSDDARMRLDGTYDQLAGEERAAYDKLVERARRGRNWDSWYDALGFIRSFQAEHGALPDAGQVQAAPGFYADDATGRMAIAAIAAGLGGVHAGPGGEPASPAASTPAAAPPAKDGEPADGTRPALPTAPEEAGPGRTGPGEGFSWAGADFRYELAYAFALGSNPPGSHEEERARDYAAWYMARHGGEEPTGEMPAHSYEWRRFADLGYPARAPAAEQAAAEPDAVRQDPAAAKEARPAAPGRAPGQAPAATGPGNAQTEALPPAAEPEPGEAAAEPTPGIDDGARPGEQPAAAAAERNDSGTAPGTSPDAAGPPPEADAAARLRALAAQHGLTVTADQVSPTITLTTITDGDRIVLRHDDISGTRADGIPTGLDEADAYLDAWRAYPGLPARALLDWVRRSPGDPAQLSLSAARAIAEECGLTAQPVHAAGQPFIVFREPGRSGTVLACRPGGETASAGLITVPLPTIGAYLRAYRATVEPRWLTVFGKQDDWAGQLTALAPYLINATSLYSADARRHVDAAADAAALDDGSTVKDELRRAWAAAAGPFAPAPDREAILVRVIGDVVSRYQQITGDGARYAAEVAHASGPEWDWIYRHVREHPDVLAAASPTHEALEQRDAGERAQAAAEGEALSKAAKAAFDSGDYPAALALIDQGETADPGHARWQQARALILDKSAVPGDTPQPETARQPAPTAGVGEPSPQQAAAPAAEPGAAGSSASAGTSHGTGDGAQPPGPSLLAVPVGLPGSARTAEPTPGETTATGDAQPIAATTTAPPGPAPADETGTQPGREEPAGDSPAGPVAAPLAGKAAVSRFYRLTRQLPDGTVREHSTAFESLRAAAQAVAYVLADNGAAGRKDAATFASRLQDAAPGTTMTHPSGYSFTIRAVSAAAPLANMDLAAELDLMPGTVFARWLSMGATPPASGDLDYQRPGAGSWATAGEDGIEITVSGPDVTRHGLVTWPQAASWIDKGVTPARLGIVGAASRLSAFVEDHRDQLAAAGACDPGAVVAELAQIRGTALAAIVEAARRSRGTAVLVPPALPGDPAWHTAVTVTRPGHGLGKAENKALERLTALRSLVREPQPLNPQEVRDAIRREINLADVARAMGNPATMRGWINNQARRTPSGRYDDSGQTWRGTGPDGLTVDRHGDDRAPHVIPWDDVLAWVAPGLTGGLREELLAAADASRALMHRGFGAVINPGTQPEPPAEEQHQISRRLREADDTAWAAIQAAPPASAADFDRARYAARDTSPVQETLFGDPSDSAHADNASPNLPPAAQPGSPAPSAPEPGEPAPGTSGPAAAAQPEPSGREFPPAPATAAAASGWQAPEQPEPERQPPVEEGAPSLLDPNGNFIPLSDLDVNPLAQQAPPAARSHRIDEYDIEQAVERWRDHPLLGPASRTLAALQAWADDGADGWMTWPLPMRAAQRLMELIERDGSRRYQIDPVRADVTAEELKKAYTPIKSFRTKMEAVFEIEELAAVGGTRRAPGRRHHQDAAAAARQGVNGTPAGTGREAPPWDSEAEPPDEPVNNSDLVIAMRRVHGGFLRVLTEQKPPDSGGDAGWREDGEPDARADQTVYYGPTGVEITLNGRGFRRRGRLSWPQIASWIDAGVTPARLGIILTAGQLGSAFAVRRDELTAAGTCDPDAVLAELDHIHAEAVNAVISAALRAHGAEAPVPPARRGGPAYYTIAIAGGPDESASSAENAVLDRLNQLRPLVHDPQPLTPQEVRTTIRQWIGDGLPAYAAALGDPAAMRAWVATQVRGPASRSAGITYSTPGVPGGRWYGGEPEGLQTATDRELRARMWTLIPWEEIPAWVQPGLTSSLRGQLLAGMPGRRTDEPGSLGEALDAAWSAIEAAPPPSPAELDYARRVYRGASPAQETLFGDPSPNSKNTRSPAKASQPPQDETPSTAIGAQGQPDEPDQAASSRGTGPDRAGQAARGANANDIQALPAAAGQEPPPDTHGDSPAGDEGIAASPPEPPAREPEAAPDLPPPADSPATGRGADRNPAAAQSAAPGETPTPGTARAAQEHDVPTDSAVADNAPPEQAEREADGTARREADRERSRALRDQASTAYRDSRYAEALALADTAQLWDPAGAQYDRFRDLVTAAAADAAHAAPSPGGTDRQPDGEPVVPLAPRPQPELRQDEPPTTTADSAPRRHVAPAQVNDPGTRPARAPEPAAAPQPASGPEPLNADDVFLGVSRLPSFVIDDLFHAVDNGQPLESVSRQLPSRSGERAAGEPDAGARETVAAVPAGLRIEVAGPNGRRAGLVTWPQVYNLLRPGATPARRQIVTRAWQVNVSFRGANDSFRAVGEGSLAAAAEDELRAMAAAAVGAILEAVRPAGRTRPPQPADEAAMTGRIAELSATLPARPRRPRTPAGEVTTGDIIGHHSYRFHPFLVTEPPRQADAAVEITGRLTEPAPGEPAGPFTLTVPRAGRQGAVVTVIPVPARSLQPLFPGHDAAAGTDRAADARSDRAPAETARAPSNAVPAPDAEPPAPDTEIPASQPDAPEDRTQEETMPPASDSTALSGTPASAEPGAAPQAPASAPAPAPSEIAGQPDADRGSAGSRRADRPGDGASVTDELERVLDAIRERRGAAAGGHASDDFSDIRRAFAAMRDALGLPAASPEAGSGQPAPALALAPAPAAATSGPPRGEPGPAADGFADIQAAFADLRDILGLPARGRHARSDGPPGGSDASVADALDQAAAEAQACARWYRDTPEWQRIGTVGRAARDLITAIREAAGDYWAEIRLDVRVRGFARTLAARTALAVSGAAHVLAGRLERAGHRDSRIWRAAWGLHQATTTFANRVMRYTPPGSPDRMRAARRIIDDLGQRQDRPGQPGPGRHAAPRSAGGGRTPNAADLASASFPVMVTRANARQATAAPAARTAGSPPQQQHAAKRQLPRQCRPVLGMTEPAGLRPGAGATGKRRAIAVPEA